jgi:hypothetical protein
VLKPRGVISRLRCLLKTWHQRPRELPEEPPGRWRRPSKKPPRLLEERATTCCQNLLWR